MEGCTDPNKWELQGKEKEMTFNLNRVDFGARVYNPTIGRWGRNDPAAELYYGYSGYNYVLNNPLSLTDPNGIWVNEGNRVTTDIPEEIAAFMDGVRGNGGDKDKDKKKTGVTKSLVSRESIAEMNEEILRSAPKLEALTGFWEKLNYYINGRKEGNIVYYIEGNPVKVDYTVTGSPDLIGGVKGAASLLKLAAGAEKGIIIIGEGMARVEAVASKIPGAKILNDMPKFTGTADQVTSQMMQYNRKWILQQMRSGKSILDIGLDPMRKTPSIFYQMEQNMLKNYQKLHPESINVIKP